MALSVTDYLRLISQLLTLATGLGFGVIVLTPSRRTQVNYVFAIFAMLLTSFAVISLLQTLSAELPNLAPITTHTLLVVHLILLSATFFIAVSLYLAAVGRRMFSLVGIWLIMSVLSTLFGFAFVATDEGAVITTVLGYIVLGTIILLYLYTTRLVWQSSHDNAQWLRIPTLLLTIGFITSILLPQFPISLIFLALATKFAAYALLKQQLFSPIQTLNAELTSANEALRESLAAVQLEQGRIDQLKQELADADIYKAQFMANMSHELRTPLNSIIGYSELMKSPVYGTLNPQQMNRLDRIHRNSMHLLFLVDSILDLEQLEANEFQIELSEIHLESSIESVIAKVQEKADEKSLPIQNDVQENLPPIHGSAKHIEQMLFNLLDNAIKFTHQGTVRLAAQHIVVDDGVSQNYDLPARHWLADGGWIIIEVSDTGIGIAQDDLSNIFTSFTQVDGSRTREYEGVGVGLAITKRLVELHSGIIWVSSQVEQGSTFFLALPSNQ